MSEGAGSWTDPLERYKALRAHADELEQRAQEAEALVAALVRKYGEPVHGNGYRAALTEAELDATPTGALSVNLDPCSGALLIRFRPE